MHNTESTLENEMYKIIWGLRCKQITTRPSDSQQKKWEPAE